jgi:uncharacterized membrane protein
VDAEPGATTATVRFHASPGTRLAISAAAGVAVAALLGFLVPWPWQMALLLGWDVFLAIYVAWVWLSVGPLDAEATKAVAMTEDLSHAAAELVLIAAAVMNLVAVVLALVEATNQDALIAGLINGAAVLSVSLSWAEVHTVFALRYARLFYEQGGVQFEGGPPDYGDFAYLAFTIGMTYQVSDTPLTTKLMRRIALRHTLLSYLFGAVVGATVINVVVGIFRGG